MAASRVSLISRTLEVSALPETPRRRCAGAFQLRHGALYQVFPQVRNGARRCTDQLRARVRWKSGQAMSLHWTAL